VSDQSVQDHEWVKTLKLCQLMALFSLVLTLISGLGNWWTAFACGFISICVWIVMFFVVFGIIVYRRRHHVD
jgi:membrane protein YdbS with pleckstrin-like domain